MKKEKIKENNNAHVGAGPVSAQETQNKFYTDNQNKSQNHVGVACHATQNAITIISLIITIILLLILAGVTINLTIGDEGIFGLAQHAGKKWNNGVEQENYILTQYEDILNGKINNDGKIYAEMVEFKGENSNWNVSNVKEALDYLYKKIEGEL